MKEIPYSLVVEKVSELCKKANFCLPEDVKNLMIVLKEREISPLGKMVFEKILENAEIAEREKIPLCQDCGTAVVFVELGEDVKIVGGLLKDAINEGVAKGYKEGYLRKSMCDPLSRKNTQDNTPAIIHFDIVAGDELKITVMPKGGGSENVGGLGKLSPSAGKKGIVDFAVKTVEEAGSNPCPPVIVGIGIGGTKERAMFLAKKSLLRNLYLKNADPELADLESEILEKVNKLGIGPQGFGGRITALAAHIEKEAGHIASLQVAINIQCHSARHAEAIL